MLPAEVHDALFGKWELTIYSAVSMLCSEMSTASQSSTGSQAERITATCYNKLYGDHWLPPSSGASGPPTCWVSCRLFFCRGSGFSTFWVSCRLHQLYHRSCLWHQLSCCSHFAEPRVGKAWAKRLEGDSRWSHISSLLSWLTQWIQLWHSSNAAIF